MEYIVATFRSRTAAQQAYNYIYKLGITCCLVSTPTEARVGCGLSLKFDEGDYLTVANAVEGAGSIFSGFFRVIENGGRRLVTRY